MSSETRALKLTQSQARATQRAQDDAANVANAAKAAKAAEKKEIDREPEQQLVGA
jgi:hypothetical protein